MKNEITRTVPPTNAPAPKAPGKQIDIKGDSVVILRIQSSLVDKDIKALEDKYSKKFDCKVVIIEANLQFVDVIDG